MSATMTLEDHGASYIFAPPDTGAPYTTPALTANLACRIVVSLVSYAMLIVPLRMLYKNSELAAAVFIGNLIFTVTETLVNAAVWSNDDLASWWPGYGLCDSLIYVKNFSQALYATCLLAILRNLAQQVGLLRANPLSARDKHRRNLVQALIMFPFPTLLAVLTWFHTPQRYAVGTLIGCTWLLYPTWFYVFFYVVAHLIISLGTIVYAVLVFFRYRAISKTTSSALSSNRVARSRAQRTRRRLYLMVMSILVTFLPVRLYLTVLNLLDVESVLMPYDYNAIHSHDEVYPWNTVTFIPSNQIGFLVMNISYVTNFTALLVFIFFGMTKDAINEYRVFLVFLGLGRVFPGLHTEYDPDRKHREGSSWMSSGVFSSGGIADKIMSITASKRQGPPSSTSSADRSLTYVTSSDAELGELHHNTQRPEATLQSTASRDDSSSRLHFRNPFLLRTHLDLPSLSSILRGGRTPATTELGTHVSRQSVTPDDASELHMLAGKDKTNVETKVWSVDGKDTDDMASRLTGPEHGGEGLLSAEGVLVETALIRESHQT